jgi:hypothetical protein
MPKDRSRDQDGCGAEGAQEREFRCGHLPQVPDQRESLLPLTRQVFGSWRSGLGFSKWFRSRASREGQDFRVGKDHREAGRSDRDSKKNFRVGPEVVSLADGLKDCGYPVTAICNALG